MVLSEAAFGLIGSGVSALGSIAGGALSNAMSASAMRDLAKYQAKLNYKYAKKSALYMPTYNRQGIESAGYNPMLALSNLSGAENSWSSLANPTSPDMSGIGSNAVEAFNSVQQQRNQNLATKSQVSLNNATETKTNAETFNIMSDTALKDIQRETENLRKQLLEKDLDYYDRRYVLDELNTYNNLHKTLLDYKVGMASASAQGIIAGATSDELSANAEQVRLRTKWIKDHPFLYGFERAGTGLGAMLGTGIGAYATFRGGKKPVIRNYNYPYDSKGNFIKY